MIRPYITLIDSQDLRKHQVTLRGDSMGESILASDLNGSEMQGQVMAGHARALELCIKYLLLCDIGEKPLFSENEEALELLPQNANLFDDAEAKPEYDNNCTWEAFEQDMLHYNPTELGFGEFFVYASCYWVDHFGAVTDPHLLPATSKIEQLCEKGSLRLANWVTQNRRPGCTIQPRFEFDSSLYDPLSITALYGSVEALQHVIASSNLESAVFHDQTIMRTAEQILRWGDIARLPLLRNAAGSAQQSLEFFHFILRGWSNSPLASSCRTREVVFELVEDALDEMVKEPWVNQLLQMACDARCLPLFEALVESAETRPSLKAILEGNNGST